MWIDLWWSLFLSDYEFLDGGYRGLSTLFKSSLISEWDLYIDIKLGD